MVLVLIPLELLQSAVTLLAGRTIGEEISKY